MISSLVSSVDHNLETNQWMGMFLGKIMNLTAKDLRLTEFIGKIYNNTIIHITIFYFCCKILHVLWFGILTNIY